MGRGAGEGPQGLAQVVADGSSPEAQICRERGWRAKAPLPKLPYSVGEGARGRKPAASCPLNMAALPQSLQPAREMGDGVSPTWPGFLSPTPLLLALSPGLAALQSPAMADH